MRSLSESFVVVFALPFFCRLAAADATSTVNGVAEFAGTAVQVNPNGIPTLVYNCAKVPSLCTNVNRRDPVAGGGDTAPGTLSGLPAGIDYVELNVDTDDTRHNQRRGVACNSYRWKRTHNLPRAHACPENNQPLVVPAGQDIGSGGFSGQLFNPGFGRGTGGELMIADPSGAFQGLIWTCDEYPPAIAVEGGNTALTYCTPQSAGCSSRARDRLGDGFDIRGEQDFQSDSHGTLKRWARADAADQPRNGIFTYHFRTAWQPGQGSFATRVIWYSGSMNYQKRDDGTFSAGLVHSKDFYPNGSYAVTSRPMNEEETTNAARLWKRQLLAESASNASLYPPMKQKFERLPTAPLLDVLEVRQDLLRGQLEYLLSFINDTVGGVVDGIGNATGEIIDGIGDVLNPNASSSSSIRPAVTSGGGVLSGILSGIGNVFRTSSLAPAQTPSAAVSAAARQSLAPTGSLGTAFLLSGTNSAFPQSTSPTIAKRQSAEPQCGPGSPCPDGSCCNTNNRCGFGPENCGAGNCTNNCDAKANCGQYSEGGSVRCPLNVCCSVFGYCGVGSEFCDSPNPEFPCQAEFGSCQSVTPPSCGGSSAYQRSIGYWQSYNVRTRQCNRIQPSDIDVENYTHLYFAFATVDPSTFRVTTSHPDDAQLMREFTALKGPGLQTWLAIGGWDFSDPGPTRTTWQDMAATAGTRSAFIQSCISIMNEYGFQGIDLDWEYPVAPDRDGRPEDMENYVSLVREMRSAFGSQYGISVAIAASYWYLRGFDPKGMEPYVNTFGLMTYDLHGPWDQYVRHIGPVVAGQTNIPEIYNWTLPLWYADLNPAKINFGLAYYGRGYTLADSSCNYPGCTWSGPSRPFPCTNFGGVGSLREIENAIEELGIQPQLRADDMMKVLTYGDQWIGYDDLETIDMKKRWASGHCFGGTMVWSVDLYSGAGSGDTPDGNGSDNPSSPGSGGGQGGNDEGESGAIVYIDPSIWQEENPEINCRPPCSFVLPPYQLSEATTISIPPMTTSLEIAYPRTTVTTVSGTVSTVTTYVRVTVTTTIIVPPVTTTEIEVWGREIENTDSESTVTTSFFVTSSIRPPVITITDDPEETETGRPPRTRTIRPPPWPYTRPDRTSSDGPSFPIVTYKPGPPGPRCRSPPSKCGLPCRIFCDNPCPPGLCPDSNLDFPDPIAPRPPPGPVPSPPPPGTEPPDPEDEKDDQDEEDDEEACEAEFNLPPGGDDAGSPSDPDPTYLSGRDRPTRTPDPTIAPPPPPPTSSPPPPPEPPKPNPDTEDRKCYDSGALTGRGDAIKAVENFCEFYDQTTLDDSVIERREVAGIDEAVGGFVSIVQSVTVRNGCKFNFDRQQCRRIMRRILDECDTTSTRFKQGGTVKDNCSIWRLDPQVDIGNLLCWIPLYRLGDYALDGGDC